ncbi:uncharacterized protein LOC124168169 [Ischnura elegans]|uniref:uncharacterized protein LOC124168169 n=1 Tax=Ischnura elegans TaxID=197161 RepID=UPI001ED88964|nr:uncharacterized protein LOC124168169 [Ischnura elegans]
MASDSALGDQLFAALASGIPLGPREEGQLTSDSVDLEAIYGDQGETLLLAAVKKGKADWVERLLALGADLEATDAAGATVELIAKHGAEKEGDSDREAILRMVRVARDREAAKTCEDCAAKRLGDALRELSLTVQSSDGSAEERLRLLRELSDALTKVSAEVHEVKEYSLEAVQAIRAEAAEKNRKKSSQECIEAMMRKTTILDSTEEKALQVWRIYETLYSQDPTTTCLLTYLQPWSEVKIMIDCGSYWINNLKEDFVDADGVKVSEFENRTAVDFESKTVYAGVAHDELMSERMAISNLANALTQLCLHLSFGNGGRPYLAADGARSGEEFRSIVKAAEERKAGRQEAKVPLDHFENHVLREGRPQRAKEADFITAVPVAMIEFGPKSGREQLKQWMPQLLPFYEQNVMAALRNNTRA